MDGKEREEVLVLADQQGNHYTIPWKTLEQYRATEDQKSKIEQLLGDDVSGYGMAEYYMHSQRAGDIQIEKQQEGREARQVREARRQERLSSLADGSGEAGINFETVFGAFVSIFRSPKPGTS